MTEIHPRPRPIWCGPAAAVVVERHTVAGPAAQELVDGHARSLTLDVPKGRVKATEDLIYDGRIRPIATMVCLVPEFLDAIDLLALSPRRVVVFDCRGDRKAVVAVGRRTDFVETRLVGDDLDKHPLLFSAALAWRASRDHLDVFNLQRRQTHGPLRPKSSRGGTHREEAQEVVSTHRRDCVHSSGPSAQNSPTGNGSERPCA